MGALLSIVTSVVSIPTAEQQHSTIHARQEELLYGSLALVQDAELFTFEYATLDPFSTNWIGLYPASGGRPMEQEYVSASPVWQYAPETEGTVQLTPETLQPGEYQAYFLARDGYRWLADPINVTVPSPPAELKFPTETATLHNGRQLEEYTADLGGLLLGKRDGSVTFEKIGGEMWVGVSADGKLNGTPGIFAKEKSSVVVRATAENGSIAIMSLSIPVRRVWQSLVSDLSVMTFNLWHGGSRVTNYHEKQLRFILDSGADVIALQEATRDHASRLAEALAPSADIRSWKNMARSRSLAEVRVNIDGKRRVSLGPTEINVWSAHLGYTPYGPYDFCFDNMTKEKVVEREAESGRTPQTTAILDGIAPQLRNSRRIPLILAGDLNAPSHLDWVPGLAEKNCGVGSFDWPTSILPTQRGLVDSFRIAHPDPVAVQATTWSPLFPRHNGDSGREEPQDRIDFVYHTESRLRVVDSKALVAGEPKPSPRRADNEWTSDHAAVLTQYSL
ncbi:putative aspartic peptidase, active, endonuclease/exonuclease/phosphatase [Septoria linicola]|nr:putative aspartic peptidase, active, endonuclease/exonuclease/phosphatase [Septoria linicola]